MTAAVLAPAPVRAGEPLRLVEPAPEAGPPLPYADEQRLEAPKRWCASVRHEDA
jgi:hypothetical protein